MNENYTLLVIAIGILIGGIVAFICQRKRDSHSDRSGMERAENASERLEELESAADDRIEQLENLKRTDEERIDRIEEIIDGVEKRNS